MRIVASMYTMPALSRIIGFELLSRRSQHALSYLTSQIFERGAASFL